jgi:spore germination cell wall hydrolase CwlJ-like protein
MKDLFKSTAELVWDAFVFFLIVFVLGHIFLLSCIADEALTPSERIVALTILGEARGEGKKGMYAVACVIQKRASERNLTPARVCLQPKQFSIWNGKKEKDLQYLWKSKSTPYARELARALCRGRKFSQFFTGHANHYCTLKCKPYWAKGKKPTKIIGGHKFYKL